MVGDIWGASRCPFRAYFIGVQYAKKLHGVDILKNYEPMKTNLYFREIPSKLWECLTFSSLISENAPFFTLFSVAHFWKNGPFFSIIFKKREAWKKVAKINTLVQNHLRDIKNFHRKLRNKEFVESAERSKDPQTIFEVVFARFEWNFIRLQNLNVVICSETMKNWHQQNFLAAVRVMGGKRKIRK